jgi:hypothetical protein
VVVIGFVICALAAYLLRQTPLHAVAIGVACANLAVSILAVVSQRRGFEPHRTVTALRHVTTALGGFFLFVWLSLP